MIQFTKLRISGFKSFVDKTELEIGPGLNGIVGPNGCGKSNLVEALRWVMGENSAKRMRGDGMEDVIFAGTDNRSARNFAEVSLFLDNSKRAAPPAYNGADEIEVIRRIEKDKGSDYKINGKSSRARDVQMLFADTVTGANSPSLVSQGRVTRMINAKPQDRRLILEESAGIAGLYARRHEAEIRLRAADTNLIRLEDILGSMESRLNGLKRQSRQAVKYKNLSAAIRGLEVQIAYLEWLGLTEKQNALKRDFAEVESIVAEKLAVVTQLTKTQNTQIGDLAPLRKKEAEAAAALQKQKITFQNLEDEIERYRSDLQETKTLLHQLSIDRQHEEQTLEETSSQLEKVEGEYKALLSEQERDDALFAQKSQVKESTQKELLVIEERYSALKENAAANMARKEALEKQIERHENRINSLRERLNNAQNDRANCVLEDGIYNDIELCEKQCADKEDALIKLKKQQDECIIATKKAEEERESARDALNTEENKYAQICAEIAVLEEFFCKDDGESFESVLDRISTNPGFEKALSRALGDSLMAALDDNAPAYWSGKAGKSTASLPEGTKSLLSYVDAPKEMHLALSYIGYVENAGQGAELAGNLKPGQSLVSADGAYWRWDGYFIQETATDRHSVYLEQKNKKHDLEKAKEKTSTKLEAVKDKYEQAEEKLNSARAQRDETACKIKSCEDVLAALRPKLQKLKDKTLRNKADQERYDEQIASLEEDIKSTQEVLENDQQALAAVIEAGSKGDNNDALIAQTKEQLDTAKEKYQHAVRDLDLFTQGRNTRRARMQAIADERLSLKNRNIRASERLKDLSKRHDILSQKMESLKESPVAKDDMRDEMLEKVAAFEEKRNNIADQLVKCEEDVSATNAALKEAEDILGEAREKRAEVQAFLSSLNEKIEETQQAVKQNFNVHPKDLPHHKDASSGDLVNYSIDDLPKLKEQKEKHIRERDSIGPVNLRAEIETRELEEELTTLLHERQDLVQAIDELRGGINKINKEARERLLAAFKHVNAHFEQLFLRLFGGGHAHLELIDSDDPLGAGLEIFAQPPGKALQSLSLMSGGEQTLASIALIFAMFLTNPSPICVLDEIDAPLDDANVDRVCDLLDEIAQRGETRFLVVTHHRLTMARMNRLNGVTMSEKGVSQLISVDLQRSFDFADETKKVA